MRVIVLIFKKIRESMMKFSQKIIDGGILFLALVMFILCNTTYPNEDYEEEYFKNR